MRNKRIFIILTVLVLLAALTTTVYAATSAHPSTPNLVGTWKIKIHQEQPEAAEAEALHTYFADGNWIEINSLKETNHGIWIGAGNTYLLTFAGFAFDEQSQSNGMLKVRSSIRMDGAEHLTAEWVLDMIDLEGNVTEGVFSGTFEGTRMEVELP